MATDRNGRVERETLPPSASWSAARECAQGLDASPRRFVVEVLSGPDQGRRAVRDTLPISIGSAADVDLRLSDRYVSRRHCRILEAENGSYLLFDEASRNGTFVNGVKVFQVAFEPGTEMQLGRTRVRFGFEEEADAEASARLEPFGELVGASHAMQVAFAALRRMAPTTLTCLLMGETGTGKELAARGIHAQSGRAAGPFIVIDCGAVSEALIEDKLFGHERGAFTGALKDAEGAFQGANGGTIFLDEVGELPLALQPKLLRVLERREIIRLGTHKATAVDVRVIAATHRDLPSLAAEGGFRQDLYYRLAEASMWLPPLRTRMEDIDFLARHLLDRAGGPPVVLLPDALAALKQHSWPGNVRELRNVLRRAAAMARAGSIDGPLLDDVIGLTRTGFTSEITDTTRRLSSLPIAEARDEPPRRLSSLPIAEARDEQRKDYVKQLLDLYGDDHPAVARQMGVNIKYARRLMRKYGFIR